MTEAEGIVTVDQNTCIFETIGRVYCHNGMLR